MSTRTEWAVSLRTHTIQDVSYSKAGDNCHNGEEVKKNFMAQFQLKNWYFTLEEKERQLFWIVHGNVYGNPGFPEGYRIHTSDIRYIEVRIKSLLVHTRNSISERIFCT